MKHLTLSSTETCDLSSLLAALSQPDPQKMAVSCGDRSITYGELEQRSNHLAHYIQQSGISENALVGIFLDRSIEIVVAILGILKAGCAYVPLDPHYPGDRLEFIAQESQYSILLTQQELCDRSPHISNASTICLDSEWDAIAAYPEHPLELATSPDHIAYVMYTSGSTGKPKGVQMPRANIVRYITALSDIIPVQDSDIYLHVASFSFSSSVRQLLLPLYNGATVILATREQTKNPLNLLHLMQQRKVTVFDGVPSVWRYALQLIDDASEQTWTGADFSLKYVALSGEVTPALLLQRIKQFLGDRVRFFNVYGQTETIGNTAYAVPPDFDQENGYLPVGYPYPHNRAYILDSSLNPVDDGEVGELYIAGGCLAQGYMNRDDLTAEKFITPPWQGESSRIFDTGDVARRRPDGSIELLGRSDFQVKIRGMRVELDEIAAVLEQHPDVKGAATAAYDSSTGEKVVVGYAVPRTPDRAGRELHSILRQYLSDHLPDYMVPAMFVELEEIPKTPSGKLDRRSLPKPAALNGQDSQDITASTPIQTIFCKAFNVPTVSPDDTFVTLGGHSLLYVQFSIKLERYLGYLPADWEDRTVAQLEQCEIRANTSKTVLETGVIIRALAICSVVLSHSNLMPSWYSGGGAFTLLAIAGYNFSRFQSKNLFYANVKPIFTSLLTSLLIPYLLLSIAYQAWKQELIPSVLLLYSNFIDPGISSIFPIWFIQVLVQCVILFVVLFTIKDLRVAARNRPWAVSCGMLITTSLIAYLSRQAWDTSHLFNRVPHQLFWLFILGWGIHLSRTRNQKIALSVLGTIPILVLHALTRTAVWWLLIGINFMIWQKYIPLPKQLSLPIQVASTAAYHIYLFHMIFIHFVREFSGADIPWANAVAGILGGIGVWLVFTYFQKWMIDSGILTAITRRFGRTENA